MHSVDYQAYKFRVENQLTGIPLDYPFLFDFFRDKGYNIKTYVEATGEIEDRGLKAYADGHGAITYINPNTREVTIYIDDTLPLAKKTVVLMHEMGHIYLRHTYFGVLGKSNDDYEANQQEREATEWALAVLAPPRVLKERGIDTTDRIAEATLIPVNYASDVLHMSRSLPDLPATPIETELCKLMDVSGQIPLEPPKEDHTPTISLGNLILVGVITVIFFSVVVLGVYASGGALPGGSGQSSMVGVSSVLDTSETISSAPSEAFQPSSQAASRSPDAQQPAKVSSKTPTRAPSASKPAQQTVTSKPQATYTPPAPPPEPSSSSRVYQASSKAPVQKSGITVYITQGGDKFHKLGCQHINGKPVAALDRNEALDEGFEACLTCKP